MKKIGIITIAHGENYGNRLQNYALSTVLRGLGYEVETFRQKNRPSSALKEGALKLQNPKTALLDKKRKSKFNRFNQEYIPMTRQYLRYSTSLRSLANRYDYFVLGSDQVWNPNFRAYNHATMFGYGLREGQAVPYAPSFGTSIIPDNKKDEIRKYLDALKFISTRENRGVEMVNELTGRDDAVQVLDPTLLLDEKDYSLIASKPAVMGKKKFILLYFLTEPSEKRLRDIAKLSKENNLTVIRLHDPSDAEMYTQGPSEFLWLFKNATLVLTDSFHGTVFSVIFKTPFVIFERNRKGVASMGSRIETLLSITNLHDRYNMELQNERLLHLDFTEAHSNIRKERKRSLQYLVRALGQGNE